MNNYEYINTYIKFCTCGEIVYDAKENKSYLIETDYLKGKCRKCNKKYTIGGILY